MAFKSLLSIISSSYVNTWLFCLCIVEIFITDELSKLAGHFTPFTPPKIIKPPPLPKKGRINAWSLFRYSSIHIINVDDVNQAVKEEKLTNKSKIGRIPYFVWGDKMTVYPRESLAGNLRVWAGMTAA